MDSQRFDRLSSALTSRFSRRDSLKLSGLGLGAAALGGLALHQSGVAQEASPTASPQAESLGLAHGERTFYLFVQTASSGTWAPKDGEEGVYTLTLNGLPAQTVYFSDRPERIVGTQSTTDFLNALGFPADNPPNAALVTTTDAGEDILVIELFNPAYTEGDGPEGATLTYDARILENFYETNLGGVAELQSAPDGMPAAFDGASLFIDDCANGSATCSRRNDNGSLYTVGTASFGCCYSFPKCSSCHDVGDICNSVAGCEDGGCNADFNHNCWV